MNIKDNDNCDETRENDFSLESSTIEISTENVEESSQSNDENTPEPPSVSESLAEEMPERPLRVLRKTMRDLFFSDQDLRVFCQEHFEDVARNVKETDDFDGIVLRLLKHCDTRHEIHLFWEGIKVDRPLAYDKWYNAWHKSFKYYRNKWGTNSSIDDEDEIGIDFDSTVAKHHIDDEFHPLRDGNIDNVTTWFFEELQEDEQCLALTVTLFEGMQLNYILELRSILYKWLFIENAQVHNSSEAIIGKNDENSQEIVFRVINGTLEQAANSPAEEKPRSVYNGSKSYRRIGIGIVTSRRNSFHGLTDIKTLSFGEGLDSALIVQLLDNPSLLMKIPQLLEIVYNLGIADDAERRLFAVLAVEKLAKNQTFANLRGSIIDYWAAHENPRVRQNAARALILLLENDNTPQEVLSLLHYWITQPNKESWSDAALTTYSLMTRSHPQEVFNAIEVVLDKRDFPLEKLIKTFRVIPIIDQVYALYPHTVIDYLYVWVNNQYNPLRREVAGILFLSLVRFEDIIDETAHLSTEDYSQRTSRKIIELISELWNDSAFSEQMNKKLYRWARATLERDETPEDANDDSALKFFFALHRKYSKKRHNRLEFAIKRWQRKANLEKSRQERRSRKEKTEVTHPNLDFTDLIPAPQ